MKFPLQVGGRSLKKLVHTVACVFNQAHPNVAHKIQELRWGVTLQHSNKFLLYQKSVFQSTSNIYLVPPIGYVLLKTLKKNIAQNDNDNPKTTILEKRFANKILFRVLKLSVCFSNLIYGDNQE